MHFAYTAPDLYENVENYVKVKLESLRFGSFELYKGNINTGFHTFHRVFNTEKLFYFTSSVIHVEKLFCISWLTHQNKMNEYKLMVHEKQGIAGMANLMIK